MDDRPVRLSVLVVDDSFDFLAAVGSWIATQPGLALSGTASDGAAAVEAAERLAPDLVIMDAFMPRMNGFAATREIKARRSAPIVVMVSVYDGTTIEQEAWAAGADAFVVKADLATQLPPIIAKLRQRPRSVPTADRPDRLAARKKDAPAERRAIDPRSVTGRVLRLFRSVCTSNREEPSMTSRILKSLGVASLAVALATTATFAQGKRTTFTPLGFPGASPWGLSADGTKIVGAIYYSEYFYWTQAEGVVPIGGGGRAGRVVVSGDGNVIAGSVFDENGYGVAAKWLGGTDWQVLGPIPGAVDCDGDLTSAWGIDRTGQTLVGLGWLPQLCRAHGVSWDLNVGGAATDLGSTVPNAASRANAVSGNGQIIVGWQDSEFGERHGARWVGGVQEFVLTPAGEHVGEVAAVNEDGTAMIGDSYPYGTQRVAWVWTARKGFTGIDSGPIYSYNAVSAMSADGSVVGGIAREQLQGRPRAWIYRNNTLTWLTDYLNNKKKLAPGWIITSIGGISADGTTIVGEGVNPSGELEGFIIENF